MFAPGLAFPRDGSDFLALYKIDVQYSMQMPADFAFDLFELDWDMFQSHQNKATELVPEFGTAGIKTSVCGPNSFTPDLMPLVGECIHKVRLLTH